MNRCPCRRPLFVAAVVAVICGGAAGAVPLQVRTASGAVAGESAGDLRIYRGIPYAAAPVGELRWRNPRPPPHWAGVRDATRFAARCMQSVANTQGRIREEIARLPVSEDCLYLNVWTPAREPRERRPVIVYLHGGTFLIGTGAQYDGSALARRGVVVVTINYRLGAFGLFAHPALTAESPDHASGNYAFADAVAALQWVKQNIAAFGGDTGRVTVMGQSAGGRLVQALRTSPCTRNLFQRAIIQSAPVRVLPLRSLADAEERGRGIAEKAGTPSAAALRALDSQQILESFPVGQLVIDARCIQEDPIRPPGAGRTHDVDLLVGSNADEGTFPYLRAREYGVGFDSPADYSSYVLERFGDATSAFNEIYAGQGESGSETAQREAFRDEVAWLARWSAAHHASQPRSRTFLYYFSHRPPRRRPGPIAARLTGRRTPSCSTCRPRPGAPRIGASPR